MIISKKKYAASLDELNAKIVDKEAIIKIKDNEISDLKGENDALLAKYGGIIDAEAQHKELVKQNDKEKADHAKLVERLKADYKEALETYKSLRHAIDLYNSELDLMEYGIYEPMFSYDTPEEYKNAIKHNEETQKQMISDKTAVVCHTTWTVDGSAAKGRSMINKEIKLMLRAFNGECDAIIGKVRWNNVGRCKEKIQDIYERINKLGTSNNVEITSSFLQLKFYELDLTYGLANMLYAKKEEERAVREEKREEERAQRELEQERIRAEREELHYQAALAKVKAELENATGVKYDQLAEKIQYYEQELAEARANKERAISMAQQTRRGYVYVISNVGSFGEDIYKIGMTRRLTPEDRIQELSNASVPFKFDIHAMIYSEDAPALETLLHNAFEEQKVNLVNGRKEFFKVKLEDIENKVKESGLDAQFISIPEARDYRESIRIRNKEITIEEVESDFPDSILDED